MELGVLISVVLVLLAWCEAGSLRLAVVGANDTDLLSLLEFKRGITNDPTGALSAWNTSVHFCRWNGVTCGGGRGHVRVVALDLAGLTLAGSISPAVGNLTRLESLTLSANKFSGEVPHLGRLRRLEFLDLGDNLLTEAIPDSLTYCSKLRTLNLTKNLLAGGIPRDIARLSNLSTLNIAFNNLVGAIPRDLGNVTSLELVTLMHNQLEGGIPEELGKLSKLTYLLLGQNRLSGEIPQAIYNLSSLYELALELNMLVGELPPNIGDTLPNLLYLTLAINMLEGHIPSSIGNASGMWLMDLSGNRLTGQIPTSLGKLPNLRKLNLEENKLEAKDKQSWQFLNALTNCSALELFSVDGNMLQGTLPYSVGNLSSSLNVLLFGSNMLSGLVPSSIGNLRNLTKLGLAVNDFTGTIDGWVGKLVNLTGLFLNGNSFNGKIPSSMGNVSKLSLLHLMDNQFSGPIPSSLGSLPRLSELYLSHNNLQGRIPNGVFTVATLVECVLSHNNLEGQIPEVSNLQQLTKLELSSNRFTGAIPTTLGSCQELGTIRMDQNFLSGSIPTSLGNLSSLTVLNLSRNNLTGIIPAALSNLQVLTQLDLSYNHLKGEVPIRGVFKNVTAVSLKGNRDLCGGALDLHIPTCTVVPQKTGKLKIWVKILIAIFGFVAPLLILSLYVIFRCKKTIRTQLPLVSYGEKFFKVSYKDLAHATDNFAEPNLVGRGSYGSVYRGNLIRANMVVAVKVFDMNMQGAERSFMSECNALRSIRHRNLLPILTACSTIDNEGNDFRALVYEFMPNGNLDTWLHQTGNRNIPNQLGLTQRIDIAVGIADALQHLHHDCETPIIHCDLKPSNILLDDDMTPHLGDFGIARFYVKSMSTSVRDMGSISSIGLNGTIGYIAPEYAEGSDISVSGDVYSFGAVLLEKLTGKRPTDPMFCNGLTIVDFVATSDQDDMLRVLDAHLQAECLEFSRLSMEEENRVYRCLLSLIKVGLSCTRQVPRERMDMRETAAKLRAIRTSYRPSLSNLKKV